MFYKIITFLFFLHLSINATDANSFECHGNNRTLFFKVNKDNRNIYYFMYIAQGPSTWLAESVETDANKYNIKIYRPQSIANSLLPNKGTITHISYTLPKAKVTSYQSGGYYTPTYTVVSARFSLDITEYYDNNEQVVVTLECFGDV